MPEAPGEAPPDWPLLVAGAGPAELVELIRLAVERAQEHGIIAELAEALADTITAARGNVIGRTWPPTEPAPSLPRREGA